MNRKATNEQLVESYSRLSSVWKVAEELGMCGQSVHERLSKINAIIADSYSEKEKSLIKDFYSRDFIGGELEQFAQTLGRSKQNICRYARQQKLGTSYNRKSSEEMKETTSRRMKDQWKRLPHPRGMLGKTHTEENKKKQSIRFLKMWRDFSDKDRSSITLKSMKTRAAKGTLIFPRKGVSWKGGWREVGGRRVFFRSRWEANYGRYLEWLKQRGDILEWEHEPETFWFDNIKRGCRSYLPDFRVTGLSGEIVYHEVKGWVDARSKTKFRRMKKYHPEVKLEIIYKKEYMVILGKFKSLIPGWEI